jgi:hypothetical protein
LANLHYRKVNRNSNFLQILGLILCVHNVAI